MCQKPFLQDLKKNFHSISYGIKKSPINAKCPKMQMCEVLGSSYEKLPNKKSDSKGVCTHIHATKKASSEVRGEEHQAGHEEPKCL